MALLGKTDEDRPVRIGPPELFPNTCPVYQAGLMTKLG